MAEYNILRNAIASVIRTNGNNEIRAIDLQQQLFAMINSLGAGYQFIDIATTLTNPGTPDQKVFYIARESGVYSNFGGIVVNAGELAILKWDNSWRKVVTGAATSEDIAELWDRINNLDSGTFYGYFATAGQLPAGTEDGYAYVGSTSPFEIYVFKNGQWSDSGTTFGPQDGNGEDIDTDANGKLQFANRSDADGMGFVILRADKTVSEQVTAQNTIYEIRYDFSLGAATFNVPANCVLRFNGGSIDNGTLVFNGTKIEGTDGCFGTSLAISGTIAGKALASWYKDRTDYTGAFNDLFNLGAPVELEPGKTYTTGNVANTNIVVTDKDLELHGNGATLHIKKYAGIDYCGAIFVETSKSNSKAVTTVQVLSNPARTEITIPGGNFAVGDVLKIYSEDVVPFKQGNSQYMGEYISPMDVRSEGGNQIVVIQGELYYEYATTIKVAKLTQTRTIIEGLRIISETTRQAINLTRLYSPVVRDVQFVLSEIWPTIGIVGCVNGIIDGIVVNRVNDGIGWTGGDAVGYGVNAEANQNLKIVNSSFYSLRHAYTTGGNNRNILSENDWLYFGPERGTVVQNCNAYNCQLAFDTHPVGVDIVFDNCMCEGGILAQIRTPNTILRNSVATRAALVYVTGCATSAFIQNCVQTGKGDTVAIRIDTLQYGGRIVVRGCDLDTLPLMCSSCPNLTLIVDSLRTKYGRLAVLADASINGKIVARNCFVEGIINTATITGQWAEIDIDGLELYSSASGVPPIIRSLANNNVSVKVFNTVFHNAAYIGMFGPLQVVHNDSKQYVTNFEHGNIRQLSSNTTDKGTDTTGFITYDGRAAFEDFCTKRMTDGKIVLPRYPSETSDYSDMTFGTPGADGVIITFVNCNNYAHALPTLNSVAKSVAAFGSVKAAYSVAGGWRWL